jgi:hypothetical protein
LAGWKRFESQEGEVEIKDKEKKREKRKKSIKRERGQRIKKV